MQIQRNTIKRNIKKELKQETSTVSDNDIKEREKETLEDMNELVYSIIIMHIDHKPLLDKLMRDHQGNGHKAYEYIASKWVVKDNHTRLTTVQAKRKEHEEDGIDKPDLPGVTSFIEKPATACTMLCTLFMACCASGTIPPGTSLPVLGLRPI